MQDFNIGDEVQSMIVEAINGKIKEVHEDYLIVTVKGKDMIFSKDYVKITNKRGVLND